MKNKILSRTLSLILGCALVVGVYCYYPGKIYAEQETSQIQQDVVTGKCGENAEWSLDTASGVLTISGRDAIVDWINDSIKDKVRDIVVESGVKKIVALPEFTNLNKVTILGDIVAEGNVFSIYTPKYLELGGRCENLGKMISSDMAPFPKITLINNNPYYIIKEGLLLTKDEKTLVMCLEGENIKIPETVTEIGEYAFYQYYVGSLEFNDNIKKIGEYAFWKSGGFEKLILSKNLETIGEAAFEGVGIKTIKFGNKIKYIGKNAFADSEIKKVKFYSRPIIEEGAFNQKVTINYFGQMKKKGVISLAGCVVKNGKFKNTDIYINKVKGAKGYQIKVTQPGTKKKVVFNTKKLRVSKKLKWKLKYTETLRGPQIKKKYRIYVKVRAYKIKKGKKVYGNWSKKAKMEITTFCK